MPLRAGERCPQKESANGRDLENRGTEQGLPAGQVPPRQADLGTLGEHHRRERPAGIIAVGLECRDLVGKYSNQFSGGERPRVSVARVLIPQPNLIVADESVSMIDASRRMIIINLFRELRDEAGHSFLYTIHVWRQPTTSATNVAVMRKGQVVEFGLAQDVMSDPQHEYTRLLLDSDHPQPLAAAQGRVAAAFQKTGNLRSRRAGQTTTRTRKGQVWPKPSRNGTSSSTRSRPT